MSGFVVDNGIESTVADNPLSDVATTLNVAAGEGALFPVTFPYILTIWDESTYPDPKDDSNREDIHVTGITVDALAIERGKEGTTPISHTLGSRVAMLITAGMFNDAEYGVNTRLDDISSKVDYVDSPGIITGGELSEGTTPSTLKVAALTALLRETDSDTGVLKYVTKAEEDNIALPLEDTIYLVTLNYNAGVPTITLETSYSNLTQNINIGLAWKSATEFVAGSGGYRLANSPMRMHTRFIELCKAQLASGATLAYSGTNNFTMTAGIVYAGLNRHTPTAYDSAVDKFTAFYRKVGGGFNEILLQTAIDYNHYDDNSGTLDTISPNQYSIHWIYWRVNGSVCVVYGYDSYTAAEAEVASLPSLPVEIANLGLLIGKIIAPVAGGSFHAIQMITDTTFAGTCAANHNDLGGLQGGALNDYYHLLNADVTKLAGIEDGATADQTASEVPIVDAGSIITAADVEAALQENRTAINLNTAKDTNVTTDLSEGANTVTTVDVNSSDGANATLLAASTLRAGLLTKAKFDEIVANTNKNSYPSADATKLGTIDENADVNNISDVNATDLTDAGDSALHYHASDRLVANITDMDEQSFTNLLKNGEFGAWSAGTAVAPDGWALSTDSGSCARSATSKIGSYSVVITRGGATFLYSNVVNPTDYIGQTITIGIWVKTAVASQMRIQITTNIETTSSSYHTGDDTWQFLQVSSVIATGSTYLQIRIRLDINGVGYVDGAIAVEGSVCPTFSPNPTNQIPIVLTSAPTDAGTNGETRWYAIAGAGGARRMYMSNGTDWKYIAIAT